MDEVSRAAKIQPKDEELEKLRSRHREEKFAYREQQRQFILNRTRFLGDEQKSDLSNDDVSTLAKNLKTKSQVTCDLLKAIMNRLLDSRENIEAFLSVDGALQSLLRVLSGQNEKFQLIAAHCICNLALGNSKRSFQVLKASVSYLTAHLSGRNCYVQEACLIALGNFSRHGSKHIELLNGQGILAKLINILNQSSANLESSAVYALTQFVYYGFDTLKLEELKASLVAILPIFKVRSFSVAFLLSMLSSATYIHTLFVDCHIHVDVLRCLIVSLKEGEREVVFYLRILSNLLAEESGAVGISLMESCSHIIKECVQYLLQSDYEYLRLECLGFLGNFINHPVEVCQLFGIELLKENFESAQAQMKNLKQQDSS